MSDKVMVIEGELFHDHRGVINSLNTFNLDDVKRIYFIHHPDERVLRGWHAHKHERKWFYCAKGEFTIALVKIDDWDQPSKTLPAEIYHLTDKESRLICVPAGYGNCIKAHIPGSVLTVLSDVPVPECYDDSWRYPADWWVDWSDPDNIHARTPMM